MQCPGFMPGLKGTNITAIGDEHSPSDGTSPRSFSWGAVEIDIGDSPRSADELIPRPRLVLLVVVLPVTRAQADRHPSQHPPARVPVRHVVWKGRRHVSTWDSKSKKAGGSSRGRALLVGIEYGVCSEGSEGAWTRGRKGRGKHRRRLPHL
jgi:hypothetical protein